MHVDEPMRRHPRFPYFTPFDDKVSTPIISHIPNIPDRPLSPDYFPLPYPSELSLIGSELPATSRTHGLTTSSQDAATPSSSSALAYSGWLDDTVACQWVDHTGLGTCNQLINRKDVSSHLSGSHRIGSQDRVTCLRRGCSCEMQHRDKDAPTSKRQVN